MKRRARPLWSIVLFTALLLQTLGITALPQQSVRAADTVVQAAADYGLPAKTADGVIFHAWNWSFDNITSNLPAIAAAGFKSIQTSPVQPNKEALTEGSKWWILYQPTAFSVGNTQLGTREQFKTLCTEADKYGISIIVDVVANHTGNAGGGSDTYKPATNVDSALRDNSSFWHEARGVENWNDRWQVTQWGIGLPDLNTSNQDLQNIIINFLNDAISLGADGFRFDAAKHIELPDDAYGAGSNFWTRVLGSLNNKDNLYIYGEVLQGGADRFADYANYINLAASSYGYNVRSAVGFGSTINVNTATSYAADNVSPSKLVTWVESHDTYANDSKETTAMSDWQIKMGWSIIASRAQTTSLFFDRPAGSGTLGQVGSTLWQDADIAAVNKFHNAMAGQGEYLRTQGNQIMLIERGTQGMTIVNLGGDAYINSATNLANGTYVNKAGAGGTFTVSGGVITGNLGSGKIAVLYDAAIPAPSVSVSAAEGSFYTDSLAVIMTVNNADSATYTVNDGASMTLSSGDTVTLGAGAAFGTSYVLKITATNTSGQTVKTYTFLKEDPGAALTVHYSKPASWGTPNIYYYDDTVSPIKAGAAWPGTAMTDSGNGWYTYSIASWQQAKVIFNSGSSQIPAAQQAGYLVTGEKWIKDGVIYAQNPDVAAPGITIDQAEGAFTGDSLDVTVTYTDADTAVYSLNGSTAAALASGQKLTIGAGDAAGTVYTLVITAANANKTTTKTFTFTKSQANTITVHYYKPTAWGTPNIYYYDETVSPTKIGAVWPGTAMTDSGNGWYSYTIDGWDKAYVIFNSNGLQIPAAQQQGYLVTQNAWIKDGVITAQEPVSTAVAVTFTIKSATTVQGQSVYLVGNTAELGNWDPASAAGPAANLNYPDWNLTINLPAGTAVQFKAIKKDANNNVVWESGSNHTYTVTAASPSVEFYFNN